MTTQYPTQDVLAAMRKHLSNHEGCVGGYLGGNHDDVVVDRTPVIRQKNKKKYVRN